jgi:CBS domain-containing protein
MRSEPITVSQDAPLREAIALMIKHQQQHILVTDSSDRFAGEIDAHQLSKLLVPGTVGADLGWITPDERKKSAADSAEEVEGYLKPHMDRPVRDFMDQDVPLAHPDMPIAEVFLLLRGGAERMPVIEKASQKLVGGISMLTILARLHSS